MQFCNSFENNLDNLEAYYYLEDEMLKYKTLNHEDIKWDKVYEYSLEILQHFSMDTKVCNYFVLSCIALNNEESFKTMNKLFESLVSILQNSPENLGKNADVQNIQKKKIKNMIEHFIIESDKLNLTYLTQIVTDLNHTFRLLGGILGCDFREIQVRQETAKSNVVLSVTKQAQSHTQNPNITSLNDREYRIFFNNLAFELLENNKENLNAYALFIEAMWGRIKTLPSHNENVTQIKYPDKNLIQTLLQGNPNELEHIKYFMSNLTLNPFWIEGLKFFCDFLQEHKKANASKLLNNLTREFLVKFKGISKLKFNNGKFICEEEILNYFLRQDKDFNHIKPKTNKNKQNENNSIDKILLDINTQNHNGSLFSSINALIEIARLFEEKNMRNNAKILYAQIKDLMEKTLLKDYLSEDYLEIKAKSEKI